MSLIINVSDHILFEDSFIIVINKPAGLMVEPDRNGHPNLQQQVKKYLKELNRSSEPAYAQHIHRLDRPVSGVILFSKQKAVLKNLSEQFAQREVQKSYQALTDRAPYEMSGKLETWHRKEKGKAVIYQDEVPYAEKAILNYDAKKIVADRYLWNIDLHTGKFHQIRAQLSFLGCPVMGDEVYGSDTPFKTDSIALHARKLIFSHPISNEKLVIESDIDFLKSI